MPAGTGESKNLPVESGTVPRATTPACCSDTDVVPLAMAVATKPSTAKLDAVARGRMDRTGFNL